MPQEISPAEWKLLRQLFPIALDRYCQRVLEQIDRLSADPKRSSYERYQAIYKLLRQRDAEMGRAFDNPRRSTALFMLARIHSLGLITAEEMARFTPETLARIELLEGWAD